MNQGHYEGIVSALNAIASNQRTLIEQMDEMRRAINRIDGRLKNQPDPQSMVVEIERKRNGKAK